MDMKNSSKNNIRQTIISPFKKTKSVLLGYKASNILFILGFVIILLILFIILFPEKLTSLNPYSIEGVKSSVQKNGTLSINGAPFPPSSENLLGTDFLGRDLLSIILYGTRYTMEICFLVVVGRFLVAMPIGIASGIGNSLCNYLINLFSTIFSTVPSLIISVMILKIAFFTNLFREQSLIAFVLVLTTVGWAKLAVVIRERVQSLLSQSFVTGEKAIGKSNTRIIIENVLPHFSPELTVLFFMEMALALSMVMQLGFFGVYVGNIRVLQGPDATTPINISYEPEWASMLSSSINSFTTAPWTVLSPAAAFFISILAFNIFGEGLRKKLQSKNSRFIVYFRKLLTFKITSKKALKATCVIASIIIILSTSFILVENHSKKSVTAKAQTLSDFEFNNQVIIGSKEAELTANNLKASLEKAGFKPLTKNYVQSYDIDPLYYINDYKFDITSSNYNKSLILGKDFSLEDCKNFSSSGKIFDSKDLDIFNFKDFAQFDDKFVVLDEDKYSSEAIVNFSKELKDKSKALGIIDIISDKDKLPETVYDSSSEGGLIYITRTASLSLKSGSKISINIRTAALSSTGRNIVGVLPGSNPKLSKEAILISMGYNYLSYDKEDGVNRLKMAIELAYKLKNKNPERTILMAFWDGNSIDKYSGARYYCTNPLYPLENTILNIDLTNMSTASDTLSLNSDQVPVSRYNAWEFNHELDTSLEKGGITLGKPVNIKPELQGGNDNPNGQEILYSKAVPTIYAFKNEGSSASNKASVKEKFIDILLSTITKNKY